MATGIKAQVINIRSYQPLAGIAVQLGGPSQAKGKTDADGNFAFNNLTAGNNYTLDLTGPGWEAGHYEDIVVLDDHVTDLGKLAMLPAED